MIIAHRNTKRRGQSSRLNTDWFTPRIGTVLVLQADHYSLIAEVDEMSPLFLPTFSWYRIQKSEQKIFSIGFQWAFHQSSWTKVHFYNSIRGSYNESLSIKTLLIDLLLNTFVKIKTFNDKSFALKSNSSAANTWKNGIRVAFS